MILFVNRPWREFALAKGLRKRNYCIGINYLRSLPPGKRAVVRRGPGSGARDERGYGEESGSFRF